MAANELAALARRQHGLVQRHEALACGVGEDALWRWLCDGRLEALHQGVYRMAGAPVTWEQGVLAAVLAGGHGVAASHRSAAVLWGLLEDDAVEVSVPRGRLPRLAGVTVHRSRDLDAGWLSRRRGIPVTNPLRTLVDLGAAVPAPVLEDVLDRALVRRLVTQPGAEAAYAAVARPGRRGAGVLRRVLDQRALGAMRPAGLLEPRMARLLRDEGLPPAVFQHEVRDAGRFVARVDFAYPDVRLALELDGFEAHASPAALRADLARQNALVGLGWTVLRFTWADVVRAPAVVAASIRPHLGTPGRARRG